MGNPELSALSKDALIARVTADETELSHIKYQTVLYGLLSDENTKLLEMLHATPPVSGVTARVLSRPPQTLYDTILIDQGTGAGVAGGDTVEYQGIALGKIVSAGKTSALAQLFSSPGSEEDVLVGTPGAIAIAEGLGGGAFQLSVPQDVSASQGDLVRLEGGEPLLLGTVVSVSSDPSDSSQTVSVRSPVSFADLDFVEVVPPRTELSWHGSFLLSPSSSASSHFRGGRAFASRSYILPKGSLFLVIIGGIVSDELFGAPIRSVGGFSYLSTLIVVALSAVTLFLRQALFE